MRKPREIVSGATYHVVARANRQEFILQPHIIKDLFLKIVEKAKKKYRFSIQNFCIMNNHIHFIIHPHNRESLSRIMQWILSLFAATFNRIYNYRGHVWYDRFKSVVLRSLRQWINTFQYINENPLRAQIATRIDHYEFSGVSHLTRGIHSVVDPPDELLRLMFPAISVGRLPPN